MNTLSGSWMTSAAKFQLPKKSNINNTRTPQSNDASLGDTFLDETVQLQQEELHCKNHDARKIILLSSNGGGAHLTEQARCDCTLYRHLIMVSPPQHWWPNHEQTQNPSQAPRGGGNAYCRRGGGEKSIDRRRLTGTFQRRLLTADRCCCCFCDPSAATQGCPRSCAI